jgi:hypothetical protein
MNGMQPAGTPKYKIKYKNIKKHDLQYFRKFPTIEVQTERKLSNPKEMGDQSLLIYFI